MCRRQNSHSGLKPTVESSDWYAHFFFCQSLILGLGDRSRADLVHLHPFSALETPPWQLWHLWGFICLTKWLDTILNVLYIAVASYTHQNASFLVHFLLFFQSQLRDHSDSNAAPPTDHSGRCGPQIFVFFSKISCLSGRFPLQQNMNLWSSRSGSDYGGAAYSPL